MADAPPPLSADVLVTTVATALQARITELASSMRDRLSTRIEELDEDGAIFELLYASIEGNIENILYSLRHDIALDNIEPPSAAYEYARRLAQRGVPMSALVRAYRLGQQHLLEMTFAECDRLEAPVEVRSEAYERIVKVTFDYIDWISQGVVTVYEGERERWLAERNSARVGKVEELIAGAPIDIDAAETTLGYRLRVHHLGGVLWVDETGTQQDQLSRFTRAATSIAEFLGSARTPLVIPRDRATAWVWMSVAEDVGLDVGGIQALLTKAGGHRRPTWRSAGSPRGWRASVERTARRCTPSRSRWSATTRNARSRRSTSRASRSRRCSPTTSTPRAGGCRRRWATWPSTTSSTSGCGTRCCCSSSTTAATPPRPRRC